MIHHSSEEDLSNPRSPQSRALVWLSDSDRRQLNPNDREALVQRYALAVFFHATEGDGWYNNTGWLTGSHECGWFGTYCHSPTSCGQDCYDVPALTTLSISMGKSASGPFFRIFNRSFALVDSKLFRVLFSLTKSAKRFCSG